MVRPEEVGSFLAQAFAPSNGDTKLYLELLDEAIHEPGNGDITIPDRVFRNGDGNGSDSARPLLIVRVQYLAEGAANAVFSMTIEDDNQDSLKEESNTASATEPLELLVNDHLLRFRKIGGPAPPFTGSATLYRFMEEQIKPLVPNEFMTEQALVGYSSNFVDKCNSLLRNLEANGVRERKRHGSFVNDGATRIGLLVENMRPRDLQNSIMIEFKFKWLKQSPVAPLNARRCRTCAWHAFNQVKVAGRYCPLALASGDKTRITRQIPRLLQAQPIVSDMFTIDELSEVLSEYFSNENDGHRLVAVLSGLQGQLDPEGILKFISLPTFSEIQSDLSVKIEAVEEAVSNHLAALLKVSRAMTLRDCSIFIQICKTGKSGLDIKAKLGDLDPKGTEKEKLIKWASDEQHLLLGGYYTGTEKTSAIDNPDYSEVCILWNPT